MGKPSATGQPTRLTQPFILSSVRQGKFAGPIPSFYHSAFDDSIDNTLTRPKYQIFGPIIGGPILFRLNQPKFWMGLDGLHDPSAYRTTSP